MAVGAGSFLLTIEDLLNQVTAKFFVSSNHFVKLFRVTEKALKNSQPVKKLSDSRNWCKFVFVFFHVGNDPFSVYFNSKI